MFDRKKIKVVIYDFDGVMTDNRALLNENGEEAVFVNRSDGLAIAEIKKLGILQVIISTEKNKVVKARAKKLGIDVISSVIDKKATVSQYLEEKNILSKEAVFIGNDINDKEAMLLVGCSICPSDAHKEIKNISRIIMNTKGGFGVVREFYDILIRSSNDDLNTFFQSNRDA